MKFAKRILLFVVFVFLSSQSFAQSALFIGLGDATGGDPNTDIEGGALGISPDGNIVVGYAESTNGTEAFRWVHNTCDLKVNKPADCVELLGDLSGGDFFSQAHDVSNNGIVVGLGKVSTGGTEAFKWDEVNGLISLAPVQTPTVSTTSAEMAYAITQNGESVVGRNNFIWTETGGTQELYLNGDYTHIRGIANNNQTIAGTIIRNSGPDDGFIRYLDTEPYQVLGFLDPTMQTPHTSVSDLSSNGKVVVGSSHVLDGGNIRAHPFKWEDKGQCDLVNDPSSCMIDLGAIYDHGYAEAVSGNGLYIVGSTETTGSFTNPTAFIWFGLDQEMRILKDVLQDDFGVDLSDWNLQTAHAISDDGRVIAGEGERIGSGKKEAWVVYLPPTLEAPYRNVNKLTLQDLDYDCTQGVMGIISHGLDEETYYALDFAYTGQGSQDEIVVASADGRAYVHNCLNNPISHCTGSFGNHVNVDHGIEFPDGDKLFSLYAHLKSFGIGIHDTDVKRGQFIGIEGGTGFVIGEHIHFGLMKGDPAQDAWLAKSVPIGRFYVRDLTTGEPDKVISGDEFICKTNDVDTIEGREHQYDDTYSPGSVPACSDGLNNDPVQDMGIDYTGIDLDKDGVADIPMDSNCVSKNDKCEANNCGGCGIGFELIFVLPFLMTLYSRKEKFLI